MGLLKRLENDRCAYFAPRRALHIGLMLIAWLGIVDGVSAGNTDPLAANNGLYPEPEKWSGPYRVPNMNYPHGDGEKSDWQSPAGGTALVPDTAPSYVAAIKEQLATSLKGMINSPLKWDPEENGWYNMVWTGQGNALSDGSIDPNSGLESLLGSAVGQIMPANTFAKPHQPKVDVQNHQVTYYNELAATLLGKIWADIYKPDLRDTSFPEGSMVVKTEAATPTPKEWPVLEGGAEWHVFRPSVKAQICASEKIKAPDCPPLEPQVLTIRAIQMSVAVKDTRAAPGTGWVFLAFTYDANSGGETPWDKFVPLGAQWGNDPELANSPSGRGAGGDAPLTQTWNNPVAPAFTRDTLGWGNRLAGPMDVATRHNVITVSGTRYQGPSALRASSCLSCHGAAEFPMTTNLYPSPNTSFPRDGKPFLLYEPGSPKWAQWFQNRPGSEPMSPNHTQGITAVDYDWTIVFALMAYNAAFGNDVFVRDRFDVH